LIYPDKTSFYEGEYKHNVREGKGLVRFSDGRTYEGEFWKNVEHGKGKEFYPDGSVFEGSFKNGKREGLGTFTFYYGISYKGVFKNDRIEGMGNLACPDSRVYKRDFQTAFPEGVAAWSRVYVAPLPPIYTQEPPFLLNSTVFSSPEIERDHLHPLFVANKLSSQQSSAPAPPSSIPSPSAEETLSTFLSVSSTTAGLVSLSALTSLLTNKASTTTFHKKIEVFDGEICEGNAVVNTQFCSF
jgi:hypothetical protein